MSKSTKSKSTYQIANTQVMEQVGRKVVPKRDEEDRFIYTKRVRISVQNPPANYKFPTSLELSRIQDWAKAKSDAGETLQFVQRDYAIVADSILNFDETDDKPEMISAIYRPVKSTFAGTP